ncbi:hypothetical protein Pla175_43700 [Pirellulimonas nuda]|uniref:Uncharacterized protein n=1 Tax=Pirellulimonas nuda TaxID=2528009 RepID=A0A518DHK5_9BACT|nr:hypothetical protein Pla175_43700 [Pirellulimonas nuda]
MRPEPLPPPPSPAWPPTRRQRPPWVRGGAGGLFLSLGSSCVAPTTVLAGSDDRPQCGRPRRGRPAFATACRRPGRPAGVYTQEAATCALNALRARRRVGPRRRPPSRPWAQVRPSGRVGAPGGLLLSPQPARHSAPLADGRRHASGGAYGRHSPRAPSVWRASRRSTAPCRTPPAACTPPRRCRRRLSRPGLRGPTAAGPACARRLGRGSRPASCRGRPG